MIYTSYFARSANNPNAVAICGKVPEFFTGRTYKALAPSWSIWKEWHDSTDPHKNGKYVERFYREILLKLDPQKVLTDLGENAILLCYESPEKFCHRHYVSYWLSKKLGIEVKEL